jgi:hypothetical protein
MYKYIDAGSWHKNCYARPTIDHTAILTGDGLF